jgi:TATA-box binding protein (TBP) (component of TFIID and TFIIIB)
MSRQQSDEKTVANGMMPDDRASVFSVCEFRGKFVRISTPQVVTVFRSGRCVAVTGRTK